MALFEDLTLTWKGKARTVKANNMLSLIARVEDVLTLNELFNYSQKGAAPIAKLSQCYGIMLRYAGHEVIDDEIYESIATGGDTSASVATMTVLQMMTPPERFAEPAGGSGDSGKQEAAAPNS